MRYEVVRPNGAEQGHGLAPKDDKEVVQQGRSSYEEMHHSSVGLDPDRVCIDTGTVLGLVGDATDVVGDATDVGS